MKYPLLLVNLACIIFVANATFAFSPGPTQPTTNKFINSSSPSIDPTFAFNHAQANRPNFSPLELSRTILSDPRHSGKLSGHLAEGQFVRDNPKWRLAPNPNDPQVDVFRKRFFGKTETGQIKLRQNMDYWKEMLKDSQADRFFVPDDHVQPLKDRLNQRIRTLENRGQFDKAKEVKNQIKRIRGTGRNYAEYSEALQTGARQNLQNSGGEMAANSSAAQTTAKLKPAAPLGRAARVGGYGGGLTVLIDSGFVGYQSLTGQLTPDETINGFVDSGAKGVVVGGVVATAVILGANPVGLPVIIAGGAVYYVSDKTLTAIREATASSPLTVEEISQILPAGWEIADPSQPIVFY